MSEVTATNKRDGWKETINMSHVARRYRTKDADPETVLVFANGERVGYVEPLEHFKDKSEC